MRKDKATPSFGGISRFLVFQAFILLGILLASCSAGNGDEPNISIEATLAALNQTATAIHLTSEALSQAPSVTLQPPPTATNLVLPTATDAAALPLPTATSAPLCIVQRDLNMRPGPGRAYEPIVTVLARNDALTADAYNPDGTPPGGPWARVKTLDGGASGWVSALPDYIQCNFDITSLPAVSVEAPQVSVGVTNQSVDDGNAGDFPNIRWNTIFSPEYFIELSVYDRNYGNFNGDGIENVNFTVVGPLGFQVYQKVEGSPRYCTFGGNNVCTPWTVIDGQAYWGNSGIPVRSGFYTVTIEANTRDGDQVLWVYTIYLDL